MGLPFFGKKEDAVEVEQKEEIDEEGNLNIGKYNEPCGVCGKAPTDKKWAGQYFHKKCLRKMKKMAKGMI